MDGLMTNHFEVTAMILFGIGLTTLLVQKNLIKKIIGLNIMDAAVFLYLASKGYIIGRAAPIIKEGMYDAGYYIIPTPSALVLTGIVVAVSITAFALAITVKLYKHYGTLDLDEIFLLARGGK